MDLSFSGFDKETEVTQLTGDLAALMVGIAARQAASATAHAQAAVTLAVPDARLLAPLDGAFNGPMAALLVRWKDG